MHEFNTTCFYWILFYSLWRLGHTCQLQDQPHYSCSMPRRSVTCNIQKQCVTINHWSWADPLTLHGSLVFPSVVQRYLSWLNEQLLGVKRVEDISDSLADGVLMIKALVVGTSNIVCSLHYSHNGLILLHVCSMLLERSLPSTTPVLRWNYTAKITGKWLTNSWRHLESMSKALNQQVCILWM